MQFLPNGYLSLLFPIHICYPVATCDGYLFSFSCNAVRCEMGEQQMKISLSALLPMFSSLHPPSSSLYSLSTLSISCLRAAFAHFSIISADADVSFSSNGRHTRTTFPTIHPFSHTHHDPHALFRVYHFHCCCFVSQNSATQCSNDVTTSVAIFLEIVTRDGDEQNQYLWKNWIT